MSGLSLVEQDCAAYCQSADLPATSWRPDLAFPAALDRYQSEHVPRFLSRGKRSSSAHFSCRCCDFTGNRACCSVCYEDSGPSDEALLLDKRSGIYWSDCCSATGSRACCWMSDVKAIAKRANLQAARLGGHAWWKRSNWQAARMGAWRDWKRSNRQAARMGSWLWKRSNRQAALMGMGGGWRKRSNWQAARMGSAGWMDKRVNLRGLGVDYCCRYDLPCCDTVLPYLYSSPAFFDKRK